MSRRGRPAKRDSIRPYLTHSAARSSSTEEISTPSVQGVTVMSADEGSIAEMHKLLKSMDTRMTEGFKSQDEKMSSLIEKFENLESEVGEIKSQQEKDGEDISRLENDMAEIKRSLLHTQVYSRKYHLLVYGVGGYETDPESTITVVRKFAAESLKLGEKFAAEMIIRNAHRLRRQEGKPTAIIVAFLLWKEREAFLRAAKQLGGTKMSVRTDLPPELKQYRGKLANQAYQLRQQQGIQTRIRERGADIWMETRPTFTSPWKKYDGK